MPSAAASSGPNPDQQFSFDQRLHAVDVVSNLVSETMAQSNGYISAGYGDDAEDKPMLVMKSGKSGSDNGGHGITALINRQLQEESVPLLLSASPTPLMSLHMRLLHSTENKFIKKIYDRTRTRGASAGSTRRTTRRPFNISPGGVHPDDALYGGSIGGIDPDYDDPEELDELGTRCGKYRPRRVLRCRCRSHPVGTSCGASSRWTWTGPRWSGRTGRRRFEVEEVEEEGHRLVLRRGRNLG
ncbi:conserved hypothetical protein [Culex quinquefasciatus]|uniref:Uncharacterized protein n=1 Tax=Culex quinquefasciatus TaxID=7176 RepID=B0X1U4_CULQU|nr:conserved hypothetical protein [Culex quinquefasciatus]|eukprot:XP_001863616.1 conserved hypothetical protein [Culex quinquefasciatus]